MDFSKEQLRKISEAKSVEELVALAKAEGIEVSEEEIKEKYNKIHKEGILSDEELDNVAGGSLCGRPDRVDIVSYGGGQAICPSCGGTVTRWKDQVGVGEDAYELHGCSVCGRTFRRYYSGDEWTENE